MAFYKKNKVVSEILNFFGKKTPIFNSKLLIGAHFLFVGMFTKIWDLDTVTCKRLKMQNNKKKDFHHNEFCHNWYKLVIIYENVFFLPKN